MTDTRTADAGAIRQRAYELWERDGRPAGQELDYWLRAEAELTGAGSLGLAHPGAPAGPEVPDEPAVTARPARRPRKKATA